MEKEELLASIEAYLAKYGAGGADRHILDAFAKIDRKKFVFKECQDSAYDDIALPVEAGQTISQPSTVARMLSLAELKTGDRVLEIGTGSGWNAALIADVVSKQGKVTSLDIHEELVENAKERIKKLKIENVEIKKEDFRKIEDKFDKIIVTAGISPGQEKVMEELAFKNLESHGILVYPHESGPLTMLNKVDGRINKRVTEEKYVFVPLVLEQDLY